MSSSIPAEQEPLLSKADGGDTFSQARTSLKSNVTTHPTDGSTAATLRSPIDPASATIGTEEDIWRLPIAQRSGKAPLLNRLLVIPVFILGLLGIFFIQLPVYPLWPLMRIFGAKSRVGRVYDWDVEFTKQLFGMLCECGPGWVLENVGMSTGLIETRGVGVP